MVVIWPSSLTRTTKLFFLLKKLQLSAIAFLRQQGNQFFLNFLSRISAKQRFNQATTPKFLLALFVVQFGFCVFEQSKNKFFFFVFGEISVKEGKQARNKGFFLFVFKEKVFLHFKIRQEFSYFILACFRLSCEKIGNGFQFCFLIIVCCLNLVKFIIA